MLTNAKSTQKEICVQIGVAIKTRYSRYFSCSPCCVSQILSSQIQFVFVTFINLFPVDTDNALSPTYFYRQL